MAWKLTGRRNLPIVEDDTWDGSAAAHDIFNWAGYPDDFNPSQAATGFMVHDPTDGENLGSFKLPFAKVIDGELKASKSGISAVKQRLSSTDISSDLMDQVMAAVMAYQKRMGMDTSGDDEKMKEVTNYRYVWVGSPMNAWRDRDPDQEHQIIPLKLIEADIAYQNALIAGGKAKDYGPLQVRHNDDLEIGRITFRAVIDGTRSTIEAGTITDPKVGAMLYAEQGAHGKEWRMSNRYHFVMDTRTKEYVGIRKFESTLSTVQHVANLRTRFTVYRVPVKAA